VVLQNEQEAAGLRFIGLVSQTDHAANLRAADARGTYTVDRYRAMSGLNVALVTGKRRYGYERKEAKN
jgi:hypothetical protein